MADKEILGQIRETVINITIYNCIFAPGLDFLINRLLGQSQANCVVFYHPVFNKGGFALAELLGCFYVQCLVSILGNKTNPTLISVVLTKDNKKEWKRKEKN